MQFTRDPTKSQLILSFEELDLTLIVTGSVTNRTLYIYISKVEITEHLIRTLWFLMASLLSYDAIFFIPERQSFESIGSNINQEIQQQIFNLIPWLYKDQTNISLQFFEIEYLPHYRDFSLGLAILGQIPHWFIGIISRTFNQRRKSLVPKLAKVAQQISNKCLKIYKTQLQFFRKTRLELGILKINPRKIETKVTTAACPLCNQTNSGPICKGHERRRLYIYKRAIKNNLIESHEISKLIAEFLPSTWLKQSARDQNKDLKQSMKFLRTLSHITNTPIYEIRKITVNRLKGLIDPQEWTDTNIGNISDFFVPDLEDKFDLPFYYIRRQKSSGKYLDIGFPQLFKWEIKCLLQPIKAQLNIKQLEILNQKILKFLVIKPIRSMKGPEMFSSSEDLLNRTIWYQSEFENMKLWRILSCSKIENDGKMSFTDLQHGKFPKIKLFLSLAQIKARGFIYVGN